MILTDRNLDKKSSTAGSLLSIFTLITRIGFLLMPTRKLSYLF